MVGRHQKIRVVHYCNQLSIGGTERTMELFCKYLDPAKFEIFAVSRIHRVPLPRRLRVEFGARLGFEAARGKRLLWKSMNARTPSFRALLGEDRVLFADSDAGLRRLLLELAPDVLHVHYSGNAEPPTSDEGILSRVPVTVTTNQFERENTAPAHRHVRRMHFVSRWMLENRAAWAAGDPRAHVLYNPIEVPCSSDNLRAELGLPRDAFIIGRIGRADPGIHDPISLKAFRQIEDSRTFFLAVSPPENMAAQARKLMLRNFVALAPSTDPVFLSRFYNTIDVLAHARRDGETFGCVLAEAMIHGRPVVSHLTPFMNAQQEVIGDGGTVCAQDDWRGYAEALGKLRDTPLHRAVVGKKAQKRALETFEARALTKRLEQGYLELLGQK